VVGVRKDMVRVRRHGCGRHAPGRPLPLSQPKTFGVYEPKTIEICEGEQIRITGSGLTADQHRLTNGSKYTVDSIAPDGKLVLNNGWRIGREFPHLSHRWVLTPHAAQGMTADWVFACQTRELSAKATDDVQFHVATTRGREGLKTYTDDFEWLKDSVTQTTERMMATELLAAHPTERTPAHDERLCALEKDELAVQPEVDEASGPACDLEPAAKIVAPEPEKVAAGNAASLSSELFGTQAESEGASLREMVKTIEAPAEELELEL